jgi:nucleoside-diphosphate-sugar epimerase
MSISSATASTRDPEPKRIAFVTGGNGYVGFQLIRQLLADGVEVHAIANVHTDRLLEVLPTSAIHAIASDYAAIDALVQQVQPDSIFHLAAMHTEPPTFEQMLGMIHCNLMLGAALLQGAQACRNRPVFVHAGTYWQFDENRYAPKTFYAAAKQGLQDLLVYYQRVHSIPSVTLVLYDIFGPNDKRPKLWSKLCEASPGSVFPVSSGRQLVELVHVDDVARGFLHADSLLRQGVALEPLHCLRSGVRISLRELLERVQERTGLDLTFEWGAVPYRPEQVFEPWQGPLLPGWRTTVDPVDGVAELILASSTSARPSSPPKPL